MRIKILAPLLLIIGTLFLFQVIGATESDLLPACNPNYATDCAKISVPTAVRSAGFILIDCSDQSEVDLTECLAIWHGGTDGAPPGVCAAVGERVCMVDQDPCQEADQRYCRTATDANPQPLKVVGATCTKDYECGDNICSVDGECMDWDALKEAVCRFVSPQADWTDAQDDLYADLCP